MKSYKMRRTASENSLLCACGCGEKVKKSKAYSNRWNRFIYGHYVRTNNPMRNPETVAKFKGINNPMHNSEVLEKKSGKNHHYFGKKRSKEVCEKISKTKRKCPYNHTDEWKKANSERMKRLGGNHPFRKPEVIERIKKINSVAKKGIKLSKGHIEKISIGLKAFGENHWMKIPENRERAKRHLALVRPDMSGSNSPQWKGGIAAEPYCDVWLDKEYKKDILRRDNCECQNPDCRGISDKLCGHHIDYDKKNCSPSNVLTLCVSCNSRANANREHWIKFYQILMFNKYGYEYKLKRTG